MTALVRALSSGGLRAAKSLAPPLIVLLTSAGLAIACVGPAEPTTLTTSLSGEGKSGAEITVLEGTKVKDQATLEGKNAGKATGKISYAVYKDSSCKELVTKAGEFEFKEGKVPASEEKTLEAGKIYYWQAHYGGDSLDAESTSTCGKEILTVKATTSLATELTGGGEEGESITVLEGAKVKDKATLSGTNAATATGEVKYKVYKDSSCKELATEAGKGKLASGSAEASEERTLEAGKTYYWQATYEGDGLHEKSTSPCTEKLTVKATTSLATELTGGDEEGESITVLEGAKVKDKATLSGTNAATATGEVKFKVYKDPECEELATEAGGGSLSVGGAESEEKKLAAGAVYYWQATYEGDSLHQASTSACGKEVLAVKAVISVATELLGEQPDQEPIEDDEITLPDGLAVADTATLSGTGASEATGTVDYFVYEDSECKELVTEAGEVSVEGEEAPVSDEEILPPGMYYWQAHYSGDALHEAASSVCGSEVTTVKALVTVATSLSGEGKEGDEIKVAEGSSISDTATLSGTGASEATGTVDYFVYADSKCEELVTEAGEVSVEGEEAPVSDEETLPVGVYYWQAVYSGDAHNSGSMSPCGSEILLVTPRVTTLLSGEGEAAEEIEVLEGAGITDTATIHGKNAATASGTVEYFVYADSKCEELVAEAGEVSVEGEVIPASEEEVLPQGTYYWQAAYSGDESHPSSASVCGSEVALVVTSTSLSTVLSIEGEEGGEEIEVEEGTAVSDTAILTGPNASSAAGYVEYNVYADSECDQLVAPIDEVDVEEGNIPSSVDETFPAGTYYWQAVYSGDGINRGAVSPCGSEIEVVTTPITLTLSGEGETGEEIEVSKESMISAQAALDTEHATTASGTISYKVYADSNCEVLVEEAGGETFKEGKVPSSTDETLSPGIYWWQAEYSGDEKNPASASACEAASVAVNNGTSKYAALGDSYSAGQGEGDYYDYTNKWAIQKSRRNKCRRSPYSWPARVAVAKYGGGAADWAEVFPQQPTHFIFRACSGAVIENLWSADPGAATAGQWNEFIFPPGFPLPTPAQDLWLQLPGGEAPSTPITPNGAISLVTLTAGGNDSGFVTVIENCLEDPFVFGYTKERCMEVISEWEAAVPLLPGTLHIPSNEEGVPSISRKLPLVLTNIHESAPNARIRVPLYPRVLKLRPRRDIAVGVISEINNSGPGVTVAMAIERFIGSLNRTIRQTVMEWAATEGADAKIIPGTAYSFTGHRLGSALPWIHGVVALDYKESFHPNCYGYLAISEDVMEALGLAVPGGLGC